MNPVQHQFIPFRENREQQITRTAVIIHSELRIRSKRICGALDGFSSSKDRSPFTKQIGAKWMTCRYDGMLRNINENGNAAIILLRINAWMSNLTWKCIQSETTSFGSRFCCLYFKNVWIKQTYATVNVIISTLWSDKEGFFSKYTVK